MTTSHGFRPGTGAPKQIATGGYETTTATRSISTIDSDGSDLVLTTTTTEARISSQSLASHLGNRHRHVMALIERYADKFNRINHVRFKNACGERKQGGGTVERFALLTEDQAYLLLALSRNSERVVNLKVKLIQTFGEYRRAADMRRNEYLPTYHQLQDAVHAVSATATNEGLVHMNVAKAINKAVGIEAGQRASAPIPQQAMLIVAQAMAAHGPCNRRMTTTTAISGSDNP